MTFIIETDWSGVSAAVPETAGHLYITRFAGFAGPELGVRKRKYNFPENINEYLFLSFYQL